MQCVTPMFYYYKLGDKKNGKVVPRNEVLSSLNYDPNYIRHCLTHKNEIAHQQGYKYIQIPCQHCWACELKKSAEWATRCVKECEKYEHNYYVTLTYNDENVPIAEKTSWIQYDTNPEDPYGEKIVTYQERENDGTWGYTLLPEDIDRFLNSLRKHLKDKGHKGKLKYLLCGEYGSSTKRPHYHLILMNCPLDLNQFYDCYVDPKNFKAHWKSKEIESLWATGDSKNRVSKGIVDVAEVEWSCIAYVARYCTKKLNMDNDKTYYLEQGLYPEFKHQSKNLGMDYFYENIDSIYKNDSMIMRTIKGNVGAIKPPRAYDRKLQELKPKMYEKIKRSREKAKDRADALIKSVTDRTDYQKLLQDASNLSIKMSQLPRHGEW